jgi:putative peptide zinc metalloprotease protein
VASAVILVATHFNTFWSKLPNYQEFFRWNTLLYMWIALGIVKVIHEFGHGLSCKAFGGECHEMGALFLCLSPCLYCNVSDSWTIPNKWKRIAISFAGIYVELVIAAAATWIWWYTPGRPFVNNVALCVMVLCSFSTIVFNANPLMRFDGYYMLADWLEIPNLRDRSNRLLKNFWCETCLGMEVQPEPYMDPGRHVMFVIYAIVAYLYRWIVTFGILVFLSGWLKPLNLGVVSGMLAVAAAASMIGWPAYRMGKTYFRRGRLPDMKRSRVAVTSAVILSLIIAFCLLPLPISRIRVDGLVQLNREAMSRGKVTVPETAILEELFVKNGERVYEGTLLARFRSLKTKEEILAAERQRAVYLSRADAASRKLLAVLDPDEKKQIESERVYNRDLADEQASKIRTLQDQEKSLLEIRAPVTGIVMGAPRKEDIGREWEKERLQPFCTIGDTSHLQVLVPVSADDFRLLQDDKGPDGLPVTIRVYGRGANYIQGRINRLPETDAKDVPIQLTQRGGGPLAVRPTGDPKVNQPQSQQYLVEVDLLEDDPSLLPGTMVKAKIHCKYRTGLWWTWRKISSLFDLSLI